MASFGDVLNSRVIPPIIAFVNTRPITALKNGMMYVMPLTIVGALFLLLANFPVPAFTDWVHAVGLYPVFMEVYYATFNLVGLVACAGVTYSWVRAAGHEAFAAAIWGVCMMVLLMPLEVRVEGLDAPVGGVIPLTWTGSRGMVAGIVIGFFVSLIYCWFVERNITIKMPDGVPPNVANAFTALFPGFFVMSVGALVYGVFRRFGTTLMDAIYDAIQTPMQGMTDSLGGVMVMAFLIPFLWFFGVHGSSIVSGVVTPMLTANAVDNQRIVDSGLELTIENGGHIVTQQFKDNFINMTGAGITIGIVVYMLLWAKSTQFKTLGRLGGGPALFNINEPITFGTPVVMNPLLAVPFFLTPMVNAVILYLLMSLGILPLFTAVVAPWTTPPIISGLIVGGWPHAIYQAFAIVLSTAIYFPFIRKADQLAHADELASHAEHVEEAAAARRNAEEMEELEARKARMLAEIRDLEREEARLGTQMGRRRVAPIAEPEGPHGPGRPA